MTLLAALFVKKAHPPYRIRLYVRRVAAIALLLGICDAGLAGASPFSGDDGLFENSEDSDSAKTINIYDSASIGSNVSRLYNQHELTNKAATATNGSLTKQPASSSARVQDTSSIKTEVSRLFHETLKGSPQTEPKTASEPKRVPAPLREENVPQVAEAHAVNEIISQSVTAPESPLRKEAEHALPVAAALPPPSRDSLPKNQQVLAPMDLPELSPSAGSAQQELAIAPAPALPAEPPAEVTPVQPTKAPPADTPVPPQQALAVAQAPALPAELPAEVAPVRSLEKPHAEPSALSLANTKVEKKASEPASKKTLKEAKAQPKDPPLQVHSKNLPPVESTDDVLAASDAFSDEQGVLRLKNIIGADSIPLGINGVSLSADVQSPVHLDEAVAFALKSNFEVSAAEEKSMVAHWEKMGAYAQYVPTVLLSADTGPERSLPASINDDNGSRLLDNTHHRRDHSITVTQPLIDLGIISDILSTHDKESVANIDQRDVREEIALEVTSTYLNLLQARIAVQLADEYKQYLDKLAERIKARVEGGGAPSADLDRIRGRSKVAEGARVEILGEYRSHLAEFKRLTRIMPPQLVIPKVLAPAVPADMQQALETALKYNPTYVSSQKKIELATDDKNKALSGLMPKLSVQYSYSNSYNAGGAAEGNPVDGIYPNQKTQNLMLVAQWALNGGTSITGGFAGAAKEREMNMRSLDVRSRLEEGIRSGYASINAAHERQATLLATIEANERVVKGFEDQFTNGTRSLFDLLDSYEQLYNARLNFLRVTMAGAKASYQIHRQMGKVVQSIIQTEDK